MTQGLTSCHCSRMGKDSIETREMRTLRQVLSYPPYPHLSFLFRTRGNFLGDWIRLSSFLQRFEFFHAGFQAFLPAFPAPANFSVSFSMHA